MKNAAITLFFLLSLLAVRGVDSAVHVRQYSYWLGRSKLFIGSPDQSKPRDGLKR